MFRHGWRQLPGGAAEGLLASLGWLLFFVSLMAHIHCEDVFGIVGENFTFPVKIDQKIAEIIWTKDKDKVAEWEEQNNLIYFTSLRNRGLLNKENGCLTIFNLENNDAGTYVLDYFDSLKINYILTFVLSVLAPPSEPEISCNISGDDLVLKCTADFQQPLNYTWKFSSIQIARQTQEVFIPKENVDASEKAACFIKFSQTEKSSEISLTQCFPDKQGDSYHKRSRGGLIVAFVLLIPVVGILGFLYRRDKELNKEDSALKDKQTVNNGVNQEEATEDAEGGNGERLSNSPSCSKEDLKS
ncbi:lymphocyte function-associated antigen 3 isoform X1 [Gavia stellata]|uniref:lymphocyte function-associated antigen 3 isoform X1 n=1 Tax=Gavia stellata TaxID=37040 RepID=UPI00289D6806|nr:lymphocyte function-associated antigen 3 isoform X1 [Gavia stellata]